MASTKYVHGGWYDNPATGQNQRFWNGAFLPVGQIEPGVYAKGASQPAASNPLSLADQVIKTATDTFQKAKDDYATKNKEFDEKNPFAYDEVLTKQKDVAKQMYDPYYSQTLDDFLTGISRQRTRSMEDERNLLDELSTSQDKFARDTTQDTQNATEQVNENAANSGLYGSGQQLRGVGKIQANAGQALADNATNNARIRAKAALGTQRTFQDLALGETQKRRDLTTEETYNINSTALGETGRLQGQREYAKQQYVGAAPGVNPLDFSKYTSSLLGV